MSPIFALTWRIANRPRLIYPLVGGRGEVWGLTSLALGVLVVM